MSYQTKPFDNWQPCKALIHDHYMQAIHARANGKPLLWAGSAMPPELLRAMDIVPIWGEPYGAVSSDARLVELSEACDDVGYTRNICAYARMVIGSMLKNKGPYGPFPVPTILVGEKNACHAQIKWWEQVARYCQAPLFVLDAPIVHGDLLEHHVEYYIGQLWDMKEFLEKNTGRKLEEERLIETVVLAHRCTVLWDQVMEFMKARPCPMSFKVLYTFYVPVINMRGTPEANEFYERLIDELADRVAHKIGAVEEERVRLLWEGMPLWHRLDLIKWLEDKGAVFVNNSYVAGWGEFYRRFPNHGRPGSPAQPWQEPKNFDEAFRRMAVHDIAMIADRGFRFRTDLTARVAKEWEAEGIISHSNRGCKVFSMGQLDMRIALQNDHSVPTLMLEASMADARDYADNQTKNRLEVFLEKIVAARKP